METDPNQEFLVETMNHQDFVSLMGNRQLAVASLSRSIEDFPAKHMMLDQAVQLEKFSAEGKNFPFLNTLLYAMHYIFFLIQLSVPSLR